MLNSNKSRLAFILSAFSAFCLLGAGCKQGVDEVPALNGEPASSDASSVALAQAESDAAAKTKAADDAKIAADMKAESDARAAEAAKARADAQSLERAKVAEADAYKAAAAPEPVAPLGEPPASSKTTAPVVAATPAKAAAADRAPGVAAELTSRLVSSALPEHFGANHGRLVVQLNRAKNHTELTVNRSEVLRVMQDAVAKGGENIVSNHTIQGDWQVEQPKAIHLAFAKESRALGLISSNKLSDAPSVVVNTSVAESAAGSELVVSAIDARSGKVFWTESKPL